MLREGGRGLQNHGYKIMKRGAANERQFAGDTASPGALLFIRGPALPSVVSGFLTADGKAGLRMKKMARGDTDASCGEDEAFRRTDVLVRPSVGKTSGGDGLGSSSDLSGWPAWSVIRKKRIVGGAGGNHKVCRTLGSLTTSVRKVDRIPLPRQ